MSHLIKKNKYLYKLLVCFFVISLLILTYQCYEKYLGNKIYYLLFSIIFNFYLFFSFRNKAIFFDKFLSILLWLGFWFKFTIVVTYYNGKFNEVGINVNYDVLVYDKSLILSCISITAIIFASILREIFFSYKINNLNARLEGLQFYSKYKFLIIFTFLFAVVVVCFLNLDYRLYQKGMIPLYTINSLFSSIVKWLLLLGFASISSTILIFEIYNRKKITAIFFSIIILPIALSSFSMLSRDMIFNSSAILYGLYASNKFLNLKIGVKFFLKYFCILIFFSYLSILSINYLRANYYYTEKSNINFNITNKEIDLKNNKKYSDIKSSHNELLHLVVFRFVGINAVINVLFESQKLSFDLFKKSFDEKSIEETNPEEKTFYETNFNFYEKQNFNLTPGVKGNTLPGLIAFLLYSGSYLFLFLSLLCVYLFCALLEKISYHISKNYIFSSLIGMILAYRFVHFGYAPGNSYKIILGIFLSCLIIFLINKFLLIFLKKKKFYEN